MQDSRRPNRLAGEKSPYLLQHAMNPVDWWPWCDEALKKAKNDGKPIFLSIGYSTCHWCHVLAHESFENPEIAAVLNRRFISIKVDREERPDLDAYYMNAVQAMTGQGGWPLSVFLTPDLKPFYGGTYFPPEPRYGMPSFKQVLEFVAKLWKDRRQEVTESAGQIAGAIQAEQRATSSSLSTGLLDDAYAALASSFDPEHGGFGRAPKFPLPTALEYMLLYHFRTGNELALRTVRKTLDEIAAGGIRDHVGGGFHRYSTDRSWLVPHFEKMLYDNALLAKVFLEAYEVTGDETYSAAAKETLGWMTTELASPEGGFYSAQDADTEEGEGVYYTWTPGELEKAIGSRASEILGYVYGATKGGNFEGGRSVLHLAHTTEEAAAKFGVQRKELDRSIGEWKAEVAKARSARARPATDTKILTGWNGLAITALAKASEALGSPEFLEAAERAAEFILSSSMRGEELLRSFADGEARIRGTLEDYAFFVGGLLDLFEATGEPKWLQVSVSLTKTMTRLFSDGENGGFFMSVEGVPGKLKDDHDGPMPSGNSVAVADLVRTAELTGDGQFRSQAETTLRYFGRKLEEAPAEHTAMLAAADMVTRGMREVVITAEDEDAARAMTREVRGKYLPDVALVVSNARNHEQLLRLTTLLEGRPPGQSEVAYVCRNFACDLPARNAAELAKQLAAARD